MQCVKSAKDESYRPVPATFRDHTMAECSRDGKVADFTHCILRSLTSARCCNYSYVLLMMGGVTTRNMQSSLQKYNELYIVASCWTIIDSIYRLSDKKSNMRAEEQSGSDIV
jgi:hypothetical protein